METNDANNQLSDLSCLATSWFVRRAMQAGEMNHQLAGL
jgi:hypothetical protein